MTIEAISFDKVQRHILMVIPPKYSIADVMGRLKSQLASRTRNIFLWLAKVYWNENIVWSIGYFLSSVGLDENTIRRYVEHKGEQDEGQLRYELREEFYGRAKRGCKP